MNLPKTKYMPIRTNGSPHSATKKEGGPFLIISTTANISQNNAKPQKKSLKGVTNISDYLKSRPC